MASVFVENFYAYIILELDTLKQNTIFRILWGLIALQSFIFAFDYPIAYTTDSIPELVFSEVTATVDESANDILNVIDIFPENSDRDAETMDYEFFEVLSSSKTNNSFVKSRELSHIGYKDPYFPKKYSTVFNPPPEHHYFS